LHQVLFSIGDFKIYSYGATLVFAFLMAIAVALKQGKKAGFSEEVILDLSLILLIAGVLGSRLLFVLLNLGDYLKHPLSILNLREGGLSLHGGLILGFLCVLWFCRSRKISLWSLLDAISPSFIIGIAIGRIGCFLNGCCYGKVTGLPWGVVFTSAHITLARHPSQIYEMLLDLAVFALLLYWQGRKRFEGEVFLFSLLLYSVVRFIVEFFREGLFFFWGLSLAQYGSILIIVLCLILIARGRKDARAAAGRKRSRKK